MIYSKRKPLKAPSYAPHHQTPPTVIPAKAGIQKRNATGIYRKNPNPNGLDSRLRGNDEILDYGNLSGMIESIGKTTGVHRKKQKPHRRHSRKSGNPVTEKPQDFIGKKTHTPPPSFPRKRESRNATQQESIGKTETPKNRADAAPSAPKPLLPIQTNRKKKQNEQNIPHHLE
ncbi:putative phage associated protein [Neisseria lactamica]|uniref:Putative phage associated protein n=1 Tax=Neisseria lactamica TaxID=486 RepID=A0A378VJZ6_NEILA|nr:putative phage associated protein [Neisseria lactamica]